MSRAFSNGDLSEGLAEAATDSSLTPERARALRRASRACLTWEAEAADLCTSGEPLTQLAKVGPWVAEQIRSLAEAGLPSGRHTLREGFLTRTDVTRILAEQPSRLAEFLCDLQVHSEWSDGHDSLLEMAEAASARGYTHMAITDHSQGLSIANGMSEVRLEQQALEVAEVNKRLKERSSSMRVLHGIEMNLSPAGEGDMSKEALARLDVVLGAFHSKLRLKDDQTERYVAGVRNPNINILAHPRGRIFNFRGGLQCDWAAVFEEAALQDVAVEIDGYPDRQDLDVALLETVRLVGTRISVGSDAHHVSDLSFVEFGVATAIKVGVNPTRILNCMPRDEFLEWARSKRK